MKISRKAGLAMGAGILSVGIFGAGGYAYFEGAASVATQPAAVNDPSVSNDTAATSPVSTSAPAVASPLHDLMKGLTDSASIYLGMKSVDLMTQLKTGKSLADVANATPGKSRDGLVAVLTSAASAKIDMAVSGGTISTDQATTAKQNLSAEISKLVDRAGHK